jgi:hypothetical protein
MIIGILVDRFGMTGENLEAGLKPIHDEATLRELVKLAVTCPSLETFRKRLSPSTGRSGEGGGRPKRP